MRRRETRDEWRILLITFRIILAKFGVMIRQLSAWWPCQSRVDENRNNIPSFVPLEATEANHETAGMLNSMLDMKAVQRLHEQDLTLKILYRLPTNLLDYRYHLIMESVASSQLRILTRNHVRYMQIN